MIVPTISRWDGGQFDSCLDSEVTQSCGCSALNSHHRPTVPEFVWFGVGAVVQSAPASA